MKSNLRFLLTCAALLGPFIGTRADTISAMGRVLPASGVIDLVGTAGDTVDAVLVKEGDWVDAGTPLARLSSAAASESRVKRAEADLTAARSQAQGDITAARQSVAAAEEEARIAETRLKRVQDAHDSEFISPDTIETRSLGLSSAQAKLAAARQDLAKAQRGADASVAAAETELRLARAALAASNVTAPLRAQVLKIFVRAGQPAGQLLFKIGDTAKITVIAEVYESDILKVKAGQHATVTSVALEKPMTGTVTGAARMVYRNTLQSMDPSAQVYAHVLEVPIAMDAVEPLDRLIYMQVDVKITL